MKTKQIALALCISALLAGCSRTPTAEEATASYAMPPELKDCKLYKLIPDTTAGQILYVVRCPNSTTSTEWSERRQHGKQSSSEDFSVTLTSK